MRSDIFEFTVNGSDVKFSGNNIPPMPDFVKIEKNPIVIDKDKLRLRVKRSSTSDYSLIERMKEIYEQIFTGPVVKFLYQGGKCVEELVEWSHKFSDPETGKFFPKQDIIFNMEFCAESKIFKFFSLMYSSIDFNEDFTEASVTFVYDWYNYDKDEANEK